MNLKTGLSGGWVENTERIERYEKIQVPAEERQFLLVLSGMR